MEKTSHHETERVLYGEHIGCQKDGLLISWWFTILESMSQTGETCKGGFNELAYGIVKTSETWTASLWKTEKQHKLQLQWHTE